MKIFVVSYDLRNANTKDYKELYAALEKMGGIEVLESTWTLKLTDTWDCEKVRAKLFNSMDYNDGIYVAEIEAYATIGYDNKPHSF